MFRGMSHPRNPGNNEVSARAVRHLVDVAGRALAPAVNDRSVAVQAIYRLALR